MSNEIDLDISCREFTARPNYNRQIDLNIEGVDIDDLIEAVGIQVLLDHISDEEMLDHVGLQGAKEYFDLIEIEEVQTGSADD